MTVGGEGRLARTAHNRADPTQAASRFNPQHNMAMWKTREINREASSQKE